MQRLERRLEPDSAGPGRDRWLLSYADYVTLLLALFVVLYASAKLDAARSESLLSGLQTAFPADPSARAPHAAGPGPDAVPEPMPSGSDPASALTRLETGLAAVLDAERRRLDEDPGLSLHRTERGLVVSLASSEFFPAGGVEIPPERRAVLAALAPLLGADDRPLRFEGHTDDRPIDHGAFPSNWELSSARAAAVARYFIEEHGIDPRRIATTGHAEWRPIASNREARGRALNRRVEIVLLADATPDGRGKAREPDLERLLEELPPLPDGLDESLRAPAPGPPPPDIPLP